LYDSVVEAIRSYVCFAGWKVQFIVVTSSSFVEAWYEKVMQTRSIKPKGQDSKCSMMIPSALGLLTMHLLK